MFPVIRHAYIQRNQPPSFALARGKVLMLQVHVPQFNSVVAFRVPRYHQVTPVSSSQPRYSVFGWFLQPGQLYDLFDSETTQQQNRDIRQNEVQTVHGACDNQSSTGTGSTGTSQDAACLDEQSVQSCPVLLKRPRVVPASANSPHGLSTMLACKSASAARHRLSNICKSSS